jgi:hypothetical protein
MISTEEINKKIKAAFWDYNINPYKLYLTAIDENSGNEFFTKEKILIRLIERLSWYELLDIFGKEFLLKNLSQALISKIRNPIIRERYESIGRILREEALSDSGWSDKNRRRLKASILSDRRYGA